MGIVRNEPPNMSFHRWRRQQGFVTSTPREVVVYNNNPPVVEVNQPVVTPIINENYEEVETAIEKRR